MADSRNDKGKQKEEKVVQENKEIKLPNLPLMHLFSFFDIKTGVNGAQVSREWRDAYNESKAVQLYQKSGFKYQDDTICYDATPVSSIKYKALKQSAELGYHKALKTIIEVEIGNAKASSSREGFNEFVQSAIGYARKFGEIYGPYYEVASLSTIYGLLTPSGSTHGTYFNTLLNERPPSAHLKEFLLNARVYETLWIKLATHQSDKIYFPDVGSYKVPTQAELENNPEYATRIQEMMRLSTTEIVVARLTEMKQMGEWQASSIAPEDIEQVVRQVDQRYVEIVKELEQRQRAANSLKKT